MLGLDIQMLGPAMPILLWMMAIDQLTGMAKAVYRRELSSEIGMSGLMRKGIAVILVVAIHIIQPLVPGYGHDLPPLDNLFAAGLAIFEFVSILENAAVIGVPLPPQLTQFLRIFASHEVAHAKITKAVEEVKEQDGKTVKTTHAVETVVTQDRPKNA